MKGVSRVLQKLLKCFSGTIISAPFVPSSPVLSVTFVLKANEEVLLFPLKSIITPLLSTVETSLLYCHKLPHVYQ